MSAEPVTLTAPHAVRFPLASVVLRDVVLLNWPCPATEIEPHLPPHTRVDLFDGTGWVGVVGIRMALSKVLGVAVPCRFNEVNVRTYVIDERGRRGVTFLTMEISSPLIARFANILGQLSCRSSSVDFLTATGLGYRSERKGAALSFRVRRGRRIAPTELDRFLTARWRLHSRWHGRAMVTPLAHEPWVLNSGELRDFTDHGLLGTLGLTPPQDVPSVLCASRVDARFGVPGLL